MYLEDSISSFDLNDCTQRNANPLSDLVSLYKNTGAILLRKEDIGNLLNDEQHGFGAGRINWDLELTLEQEDGELNYLQQDTLSTVLFIYLRGSHLHGPSGNMIFQDKR